MENIEENGNGKSMKKHNGLKIFIMILVIAIILFLVMEYWFKAGIFSDDEAIFSDDEAIFGANGNSMSYINEISPKTYTSLDEALIDNDERIESEKQICPKSKLSVYENTAEKYYKALPAWGVTDNSNVQNVTVDGQKIDEVHEIDVDGETYYLWIIYDLQTQNKVSDVIIE